MGNPIMKYCISILCLLVCSHLALAQDVRRQRLPYEYDFLDAIFDVYGYYHKLYTVRVHDMSPFFILAPAENHFVIDELMCEETTSYYLFFNKYTSDNRQGNTFTASKIGLINIGFCGLDNERLNDFITLIDKNGEKHIEELINSVGPDQAMEYDLSFKREKTRDGDPIIYYPLFGGGHGGGFAYTATTTVPNKKKRLIIQILVSDVCRLNKEVKICHEQGNRLMEFTRNILERYAKY